MVNFIQTMEKVAENVAGVEGVAALEAKAAYNAELNNLNTAAGVMLTQIKLAPQTMVYILPRYNACPGCSAMTDVQLPIGTDIAAR